MITIWNSTIQNLALSEDKSSVRLAFHLLPDKPSLVYWFIASVESVRKVGLPWLPQKCPVGHITYEFLNWSEHSKRNGTTYLKQAYDNYLGRNI